MEPCKPYLISYVFIDYFPLNISILLFRPFVRVQDLNYQKTEKIGFILEKFQNIGKVKEITLLWSPTTCQSQDCNLYVQNVTLTLLNEYPMK